MGTSGRSSIWWNTALAAAAALCVVPSLGGCATGGGEPETGRGGPGTDGGRFRTDGGSPFRRDGGGTTMPRDSGPTCMDDTAGAGCGSARDLGAVMVGGSVMTDTARIPVAGGEDWYAVTIAPLASPMTFGGGAPTIQLTMNEGDAFRFDVFTACGTPATCAMGMPVNLTEYSFTDDQSMPGDTQWSTRDQSWPTNLKIRVHRTTSGSSCAEYILHISR